MGFEVDDGVVGEVMCAVRAVTRLCLCARQQMPYRRRPPGVGTRIYSFGVGAESDRPDGCEAVREAIEQGAATWREVSAMTGISHEWARQLGARIGVKPAKPVESDRPQSAKAVQAGPHRRKRKPQWNAPEFVDRFWSQVEQNGPYATGFDQPTRCSIWQGRTDAQNYGLLSVGRFRMSAHRYSYRLHLSRTPCIRRGPPMPFVLAGLPRRAVVPSSAMR